MNYFKNITLCVSIFYSYQITTSDRSLQTTSSQDGTNQAGGGASAGDARASSTAQIIQDILEPVAGGNTCAHKSHAQPRNNVALQLIQARYARALANVLSDKTSGISGARQRLDSIRGHQNFLQQASNFTTQFQNTNTQFKNAIVQNDVPAFKQLLQATASLPIPLFVPGNPDDAYDFKKIKEYQTSRIFIKSSDELLRMILNSDSAPLLQCLKGRMIDPEQITWAFEYAIRNNKNACIDILLEDFDVKNNMSALEGSIKIAIQRPNLELMHKLLKANVSVNPDEGLYLAASTPCHHIFHSAQSIKDTNKKNISQMKKIMQHFIDHGGNINAITPDKLDTALHAAVINGHSELVKLLLSLGANPNLSNRQGNTPLHMLLEIDCDPIHKHAEQIYINPDIIKQLLAVTDLSIKNTQGQSVSDLVQQAQEARTALSANTAEQQTDQPGQTATNATETTGFKMQQSIRRRLIQPFHFNDLHPNTRAILYKHLETV